MLHALHIVSLLSLILGAALGTAISVHDDSQISMVVDDKGIANFSGVPEGWTRRKGGCSICEWGRTFRNIAGNGAVQNSVLRLCIEHKCTGYKDNQETRFGQYKQHSHVTFCFSPGHDSCEHAVHSVWCTMNQWSEWSNCSKPCNGGSRSRNRTVKTQGYYQMFNRRVFQRLKDLPMKCPTNSEKQICNKRKCECSCEHGTPANGSKCTVYKKEVCFKCSKGHHMQNKSKTCAANVCACQDGVAANTTECKTHNTTQCAECSSGFSLDNDTGKCDEKSIARSWPPPCLVFCLAVCWFVFSQ